MPDKKINQFGSATTPLTGTELVPIVQEGVNVKATTQDIADLASNIGAVYESNVPFNDIGLILNNTFSNYYPSEILESGKKIVVYSNQTLPIELVSVYSITPESYSLRWTNGGGLGLYYQYFYSGKYLSILETPKIANNLRMEYGEYRISTFNFTTEHISLISFSALVEFLPDVLDLSSLKSFSKLDIFLQTDPPYNKTIDLSGLECFGGIMYGDYVNLGNFGEIILPTNLKSACSSFNFQSCYFSQETVDAILQMFVNLDGTGDKQLWEGASTFFSYSLNLSGSCASPSAAGLVNKAILQARNYVNVYTN